MLGSVGGMRSVPGVRVGWGWVAAPVVALDGVEPVFDVAEGLAADVVDVNAAVAGMAAAFYEAGGAQDAKVLADEWLAASEGVGEPGGGAGLVRERPDDPLAHVVGEEVQRGQGGWLRPPVAVGGLHVALVMHGCLWLTRIAYSYAARRGPAAAGRAAGLSHNGAVLDLSGLPRRDRAPSAACGFFCRWLFREAPEIDLPWVPGASEGVPRAPKLRVLS